MTSPEMATMPNTSTAVGLYDREHPTPPSSHTTPPACAAGMPTKVGLGMFEPGRICAHGALYSNTMFGPLAHLKDTRENKYALQLALYRRILESNAYGLDVEGCRLARFSADGSPSVQMIEVPYFRQEADLLLGTALANHGSAVGFDRDACLKFDEASHRYRVQGDDGVWRRVPKSVTGIVSSYAPPFVAEEVIARMKAGRKWGPENKYWGKSNVEITEMWNSAAALGTAVHNRIEMHYKGNPGAPPANVHPGFETFWAWATKEEGYTPVRSEWPVHCGLVAGTIDMVYRTPEGRHVIVDWKVTNKPFLSDNIGTPLV